MAGLALNEDADHFYDDRGPEKMTVAGLEELVDHYSTPAMKELFFNVNSQRTSYRSAVWDAMWDGYDPTGGEDQALLAGVPVGERPGAHKGIHNAWLCCQERSIDPFTVWINRARQRGHSPWLSMRMNDVHCVDNPQHSIHNRFWKSHPEYRRVSYRFESWPDRAFDYGHKEVREHHLALVKEVLGRYDLDGLELDWMRFGFHFRPGFEAEGGKILIDFHRTVRELANARARQLGHPVKIGVRVPTRPQTARGLGLDAVAWAKLGLIDYLVVTPFWATSEFDIPIELWKELLGDAPVVLAAGLEINLRPTPKVWPKFTQRFSNTAETVFGAAASLLHRGADRIYLFNYMDSVTTVDNPADYAPILNYAGSLETLAGRPRRHVVTYSDTWAPGEPEGYLLPAVCRKGRTAAFRIHIGTKPASGAAQVYLGLGEEGRLDPDALEVRVNGTVCPKSTRTPFPQVHSIVQKPAGFDIPPGTLHDGYNLVEATATVEQDHQLVWAEIMLRP